MPPEDSEQKSAEEAVSSEQDKVELDLDDAPFLNFDDDEEEEEESDSSEEEVELEPTEQKSEAPKKSKKKLIIFGGLGSLAVAGGIGFWLFLRSSVPPEPPPPPPPPKVEKKAPKPKPKPEAEPLIPEERRVVKLEPFFIEYQQGDQSRFLECSLSLSAPNILQNDELRRHMVEIRDALYFYLKNKDIFFLENQKNAGQFKKEVLDVINQHLVFKPVNDILIDKYLVR